MAETAIVAAIASATGASATTVVAVGAAAAAAVSSIAISSYSAKKAEADARKEGSRAPRDITVRSAIEPARIIYGTARTSGPVVYTNTAPTPGTNDNSTLWTVISLCQHEIEDITEIWLDGDQILSSQIDWAGTGGVTSGKYGPIGSNEVTNFYRRLGTDTQTHVTELSTAFTDWTSSYDGRGVAYIVTAFELGTATGEGVWAQGAPQNIRAVVKGKKVYDPRLDSTQSGGSGTHRLADPTTWEWSDNPALCLADYLFDSRLGMGAEGITYNDIDWDLVASAAAACDVTVTTPSGSQKRFTCNGALSTGETYAENIKQLLSAMSGQITWSGGKFRIRAAAYEAPTYSFTGDDVIGDVQIQPERTRTQRYNKIRGTFIDPDSDYVATEFIPVENTSYRNTRDAGQTLTQEIRLPFTNDEYMAQRIAYKQLNLNNQQLRCIVPLNYKAMKVAVGDRIQLTIEELSWSNKVFRVDGWQFAPESGFNLELQEDSSSAYADPGLSDYSTRTLAGTIDFADQAVSAPSGLQANAEGEAVLLEWEEPPRANGYDEVVVYASTDSAWANAAEVGRTRATTFRHELPPGQQRYYWVRSVDGVRESVRDPDSDTTTIQATAIGAAAVIGGAGDSTIVDTGGNPIIDEDLLNEYNAGKTISLLLNQDSSGSTFNGNGAFVGVSNAGSPVLGTDGFFIWNGVKYTVSRNYLGNYTFVTSALNKQGYIAYDISDQTPFSISGFGSSRIAFVWKENGQWYYDDDNFNAVTFTPTQTMLALAYLNKDGTQFVARAGLLAEPVQLTALADIVADYISAGTIDASVINVTNLDADEITTGSLSADFITIDGVTLDTDGAGTLIIKNGGVDTDQIAVDAVTAPKIEEGAVKGKTLSLLLNQNSSGGTFNGNGALVGVNNAGEPVTGTDGFFIWNGVKYTVSRNQVSVYTFVTSQLNKKGYLVYDIGSASFTISGFGSSRVAFVWKEAGQWYYDNDSTAVAFSPAQTVLALAYLNKDSGTQFISKAGLLAEPVQIVAVADIFADYISAGTIDASIVNVTNLNATNITTGTLNAGVVTVTNLNASNITSGTLNASVVSVTNLNADNITTGTLNASNIQLDNVTLTASGGNLIVKTAGVNTDQLALRSATDTFRAQMASNVNYSTSWTTLVSISGQAYNGNDIAEISWGIGAHPEASGAPYIAIRILIYAGGSLQATQYFIGENALNLNTWAQIQQALFASSMQYFIGFSNSNWAFYLQAATNTNSTGAPRQFRAPGTFMQIVRLKR